MRHQAVLAAHADWSVDPRKRWVAVARRDGTSWRLDAPQPVGPIETFLPRLRQSAQGGASVLGIDLPIGLPRAYAMIRPEADFPSFLRGLHADHRFFEVCAALADLGVDRPFYPLRPRKGMRRAEHLAALGLTDPADFWRECDRATALRPAAAPIFWTVGANQVGKAALSAWRDMLLPALAEPETLRLWPFDGPLRSLLAPHTIVLAETYPAEALRQLGLKLVGSKRRQADRLALADPLAATMARLDIQPGPTMEAAMASGFGADAAGEDRFDSVIGLFGLLDVLRGTRSDAAPDDPWIRTWEGWILGQAATPRTAPSPALSP